MKANRRKTTLSPSEDAAAIKQQDVACIIYNSGASEAPKGAMLTHRSILANLRGIDDRFKELNLYNEVAYYLFCRYLMLMSIRLGFIIKSISPLRFTILPRPEYLSTAMYEVRPTLMTAVPRVYDVIKDRLEAVFRQQGPLAKWLFAGPQDKDQSMEN